MDGDEGNTQGAGGKAQARLTNRAPKPAKASKHVFRKASSPRLPAPDLRVLKFHPDGTAKVGLPGRPTNLAAAIREKTNSGRDLVNVLIEIGLNERGDVRYTDQVSAIGMLLDRGWGRAVQTIAEIDATSSNLDLATLSSEELATLGTILARAQKPAS